MALLLLATPALADGLSEGFDFVSELVLGFIILVLGAQALLGLVFLGMNLKGRRNSFVISMGIFTGLLTLSAGGWLLPKLIEYAAGSYLDLPFISEEGPVPLLTVVVGVLELAVAIWALSRKPVPPPAGAVKHR